METVPSSQPEASAPATRARLGPAQEYWLDAWQRSILFLETLRERGNRSSSTCERGAARPRLRDRAGAGRPHACPDRQLRPGPDRPADGNDDATPTKPPFIVVDPRAGHGPGIGGMKQDSEIGVALAAGHPCYFIGFLPEPVPGQTVEDVCHAEAEFVEEVTARHPKAEGKPVVIANCQAGWQMMMMAALRPGAHRARSCSPARRSRTGRASAARIRSATWGACSVEPGSPRWPEISDAGRFDGANLIANFESMNPATPTGRSSTTSTRTSTRRRRGTSSSRPGGAPRS